VRAGAERARAAPGLAGAAVTRAAAAGLLLVALGVFHIWSRTRVIASGYELGALQKQHAKLSSERDRLQVEVETLRSPQALERYARTRLGMAPPAPGAVLEAGPRFAAGGAGGVGVGHRPGPAGPSPGRAAAGRAAEPGVRIALRGPPGAGGVGDAGGER
jgi:cell division protein FtsL